MEKIKTALARVLSKPETIHKLGKWRVLDFLVISLRLIKKETWKGLKDNLKYLRSKKNKSIPPIPPLWLRFLVSSRTDIDCFLDLGRKGADSIVNALKKCNLHINQFECFLDFGCGCGRVIRFWDKLDHAKVYGSDYNIKLINWCKENLKFAKFEGNQSHPPLLFNAGKFDFIYALSVFTHFPEAEQYEWKNELTRVLKPEGYLLITVHGDSYLTDLNQEEKKIFLEKGMVVKNQNVAGTNHCGAYHRYDFIRDNLASDYKIIHFEPEGAKGNPNQDLYILQKKA